VRYQLPPNCQVLNLFAPSCLYAYQYGLCVRAYVRACVRARVCQRLSLLLLLYLSHARSPSLPLSLSLALSLSPSLPLSVCFICKRVETVSVCLLSVCLSVCLAVSLSLCLAVSLFVCLSLSLCVYVRALCRDLVCDNNAGGSRYRTWASRNLRLMRQVPSSCPRFLGRGTLYKDAHTHKHTTQHTHIDPLPPLPGPG
jgi:hypothetical protein